MKNRLFILLSVLISVSIHCQAGVKFVPILKNFMPKDYLAANQNWCITQANDGLVYIANQSGMLRFDGKSWKLISLPGNLNIRSVHAAKDGRIYIGTFEDMGFFSVDEFGQYRYESLRPQFGNGVMKNDEIWSIFQMGDKIIFRSFSAVFIYDYEYNSYRTMRFPENAPMMFIYENELYASFQFSGLARIDLENLSYSRYGERGIKDIVGMFKRGERTLAITVSDGIKEIRDGRMISVTTRSDEIFRRSEINKAAQTDNGDIIIGTISEGVVILDKDLRTKGQFNVSNALLPNNTVLGIFPDNDGNIWFSLDNGISVYSPSSPLRKTDKFAENVGTIYSSTEIGGRLYLGTNQGLYILKDGCKKIVSGQVWDIQEVDGLHFCGNSGETLCIGEYGIINVGTTGGVCFARGVIHGQDILLQGSYSNLSVFRKSPGGEWKWSHDIEGFSNPVRYIEIDHKGRIWCTHFRKGLYYIELTKDLHGIEKETRMDLAEESSFNVFKVNNQTVFTTRNVIYTYDEISGQLVPYEKLTNALGEFSKAYRICRFSEDEYWFITPVKAALVHIDNNEIGIRDVIPFAAFGEDYIDDQQNIVSFPDGRCFFCFENSLGQYDSRIAASSTADSKYGMFISSVKALSENGQEEILPVKSGSVVPVRHNSRIMEFEFCTPVFSGASSIFYRWKLEGYDKDWNEFSENDRVVYPYLTPGKYELLVKAYDSRGNAAGSASYLFRILNPVATNPLMISAYCLLALAIGILTYIYVKKKIKKSREIVEQKHSKEMLALRNEYLEKELNFKSKELASSTMSIILKNSVLAQIKEELTKQKQALGIHFPNKYFEKITKLIDSNISSEEDWRIFQANFDLIHEHFFRTIKSRCPDLTDSDLRLCAYLHLNLTTKELANLLNISIRGVEAARYRLRKKLEVPKDKTLTEFLIMMK